MSVWLAWVRNLSVAYLALNLFAWIVTEFVAALFGFDAHLGDVQLAWYGLPLYGAWDFMRWSAETDAQPWGIVFGALLLGTLALAAYGVLVLSACLPPPTLPRLVFIRRGYASWANMSQHGLLRANGLALGAVRRHALAPPDIVSAPSGNVLFVSDPEHTEAAVRAAIADWRGALVIVDGAGALAHAIPRTNVLRFAPGRPDALCFNPMLALPGGAHAWANAKRLAAALLVPVNDERTIETLAAIMLHQLLTAPLDERCLASLRRRLAQPDQVLQEVYAHWDAARLTGPSPQAELARFAIRGRAEPSLTLNAIRMIDEVLAPFADGAYADATSPHQVQFADLVAGGAGDTLVLQPPLGEAARAAPLFRVLLSQLVTACADAPDIDCLGRPKQRDLLIVMDAAMSAALAGVAVIPSYAAANGCRILVQAHSISTAPNLCFGAIVSVGPQTAETGHALSKRGGVTPTWRRLEPDGFLSAVMPHWEQAARCIVGPSDLSASQADAAHIFVTGMRPIRALALTAPTADTRFADCVHMPPAFHAWNDPPLLPPPADQKPASVPQPTLKLQGGAIRKALRGREGAASSNRGKRP